MNIIMHKNDATSPEVRFGMMKIFNFGNTKYTGPPLSHVHTVTAHSKTKYLDNCSILYFHNHKIDTCIYFQSFPRQMRSL